MSPQVTAAIIAASVSFLTLIGTLLTAWLSRRATRGDLVKQREQLNETLAAQSEQLDKTLAEHRLRTHWRSVMYRAWRGFVVVALGVR